MSEKLVHGSDWEYTPVVVPACSATFIDLSQGKPEDSRNQEPT